MAEMLMIILIVGFIVGGIYLTWIPLIRAWKAGEWGWVAVILFFGWIGGAAYLVAHPKEQVRGHG
jgi:hypothetical protein